MADVHYRFLIIGAGPTGLGAGYRLRELGHSDFLIVDAASHVGGLASSFRDDAGFTWDVGGHVQYSHYAYFDDLMIKSIGVDNWLVHQRNSWVWMRQRFIPYPLQNNLRYLPKDEMWQAVQGLIAVSRQSPLARPKNFKEWIHVTFGSGLGQLFMEPYNSKVWAHPIEAMNYEWIGERVAVTDLERALKNVFFELDDLSWGPNNTFKYPKKGGTGAIWEGVANLVGLQHIRLNAEVKSVDPSTSTAVLSNGDQITYEYLLSTMPIDRLVSITEGLSPAALEKAKMMRYSSTNIVGIGLGGTLPKSLKNKCWIYFPEDDCPFYRVTVFSNYSPNNVPDASCQWSLMAEVSESHHRPVDNAALINDVLTGMAHTRLITADHPILSTWQYRAAYGYPTPFLGRDDALHQLHAELEPRNIFSRGRFGGWKYEVSNQDYSLMQGVEWVSRVLQGIPESTCQT